jgi:PAS domain S-box-containing protein
VFAATLRKPTPLLAILRSSPGLLCSGRRSSLGLAMIDPLPGGHAVARAPLPDVATRERDDAERLRKRLQLTTEVTQVGFWDFDPATGAVAADERSRALLGLDDAAPTTLEALTAGLHDEDRERVRVGLAGMLAAGRAFFDDCRAACPHEGALRWIAIAADAHQGPDEPSPRVLGIVHDVSDRKRAEEEHARLVAELSRAVHVSEMFVGILGHDLRNPLGAVLAGAQLLRNDVLEPKAARVVARIVSSSERMGRMIEQLLDFTRARLGEGIPLTREPIDLALLAGEIVDECRAASSAARLRITAMGDTTGAWDRDRVAQVLSNLVANALQHGDAGGEVAVSLDGADPARVALVVQNRGAIPADLLPVLFDPFRGTREPRRDASSSQGLGLGLYVARQIALAHGGELDVGVDGGGTTFTLALPRSAADVSRAQQDLARDEEQAAFEQLAARPSISAVTAQLFGATPLHERVPGEHAQIVARYGDLLGVALDRRAYRGQGERLADELRALAERLGDLGASPREVTEVHARALRTAVRGVTATKTQALLAEGRMLALELMGNLASYYRRRSRGPSRAGGAGT